MVVEIVVLLLHQEQQILAAAVEVLILPFNLEHLDLVDLV